MFWICFFLFTYEYIAVCLSVIVKFDAVIVFT